MIYLASPYSHKNETIVERRYRQTMAATAHFIQQGHVIYSPIVHFHELAKRHALPTDAAFWEQVNTTMLLKADELWVLQLPDWSKSIGVQHEIETAERAAIPFIFVKACQWLG